MKFIIKPNFHNGLKVLCDLKSFIHQMESLTKANGHDLFTHIFNPATKDPLYQFDHMITLQNRQISSLTGTNAEQTAKIAKIKGIWSKFFQEATAPAPDKVNLIQALRELKEWISSHESRVNVQINRVFENTALVVVIGIRQVKEALSTIPNYPILGHAALTTLYDSFEAKINWDTSKGYGFRDRTRQLLAEMISYSEGTRVVREIMNIITKSTTPITITMKSAPDNKFTRTHVPAPVPPGTHPYTYQIQLEGAPESCVCTLDTGRKKSFYSSEEMILFHELVHFLHFLNPSGYTCATSLDLDHTVYTDNEEGKTIAGSPGTYNGLSEKTKRKQQMLFERYGHIKGCNPNSTNYNNLAHAVTFNISGDFPSIVPKMISADVNRAINESKSEILKAITKTGTHPAAPYSELVKEINTVIQRDRAKLAGIIDKTKDKQTLDELVESLSIKTLKDIETIAEEHLRKASSMTDKERPVVVRRVVGTFALQDYTQVHEIVTSLWTAKQTTSKTSSSSSSSSSSSTTPSTSPDTTPPPSTSPSPTPLIQLMTNVTVMGQTGNHELLPLPQQRNPIFITTTTTTAPTQSKPPRNPYATLSTPALSLPVRSLAPAFEAAIKGLTSPPPIPRFTPALDRPPSHRRILVFDSQTQRADQSTDHGQKRKLSSEEESSKKSCPQQS